MALSRANDSASAAIIAHGDKAVLEQKHVADKAALCQQQLDALKAALEEMTEQRFLEIGAQIFENCEQLVQCARKYRKQDPQNTQASDFLFQEIATQVVCVTTAMTPSNSLNSYPLKTLKSSEKTLGEAIRKSIHAYLYSEPLGDTLNEFKLFRNTIAAFTPIALTMGVVLATISFIALPISIFAGISAIFVFGGFASLTSWLAYQLHKDIKKKISDSPIFGEFTVLQQKNTEIIGKLNELNQGIHQLERGKTLLRSGDLKKGLACFHRIPQSSPFYEEAMSECAFALSAELRHEEALPYYREVPGLRSSLKIHIHLARNHDDQPAKEFLMGIYSKEEKAEEKLTEKSGDRTLSPLSRCSHFLPATAKPAQQGQNPGSELSLDF